MFTTLARLGTWTSGSATSSDGAEIVKTLDSNNRSHHCNSNNNHGVQNARPSSVQRRSWF